MVARALLHQSGVPLHFWGDAVFTAIHIINIVHSKIIQNKSSFELLHKKPPVYEHLTIFGCLCFVSTLTHNRKKFDPRASKCIFLEYPNNVKDCRVYDLRGQKVFISRNIVFHEHVFPFHSSGSSMQLDAFH